MSSFVSSHLPFDLPAEMFGYELSDRGLLIASVFLAVSIYYAVKFFTTTPEKDDEPSFFGKETEKSVKKLETKEKSSGTLFWGKATSIRVKSRAKGNMDPNLEPVLERDLSGDEESEEDKTTFHANYRLGEELGSGAFSIVKEGFNKAGESFAIKIVDKAGLTEDDLMGLMDEISLLQQMNHPHITRIHGVFQEVWYAYLVLEKMSGGELFDRIVQKQSYNEKEARDTCLIILSAVKHCHDHNIAHRDLKPENLLLPSMEDDSNIKLADFGFAKKCLSAECLTTQCGTPGYIAPEILEGKKYGTQADMWSLGVIVFILIGGYSPFEGLTLNALFLNIRKGEYEFKEKYWSHISSEAKATIETLLTLDPAKRSTASAVLKNSWLQASASDLEGHNMQSNLENFRLYNAKRKFRSSVHTVMALNRIVALCGKMSFSEQRLRRISKKISVPVSALRKVTKEMEIVPGTNDPYSEGNRHGRRSTVRFLDEVDNSANDMSELAALNESEAW